MNEKRFNYNLRQLCRKCSAILPSVFLFCLAAASAVFAQSDQAFDSSAPILISQADSTIALTANPDNWRGALPGKTSEIFPPGSRLVVFVTNIDLLPDENANAFRAFAEDINGKRYRLIVENIQQLRKQNWIYGLTLRLYDANGYNGQPPPGSELSIRVGWRGNISNRVRLNSNRSGVK